ncbi:MAG: NAD-dependent 4,6-dehydratase LegB [Syntrophomonas sp.]
MNLKSSKIMVTGADGFIGSHLTEQLVSSGYNVRALVLYNSFNSWGWLDYAHPQIIDNLEIVYGDVRDPHGIYRAMRGCNVVMHLAALVAIPYSYHSPDSYVDTNIKGTLNILQAARSLGVERLVHTSSSEVYGSAQYVPIDERHPLQGQSPYSASKIGADQIAMSFYSSYELPLTIIRPFNTYGPRQSARAIIPTIITQLLNGNKTIKLGAIHTTRTFNYVKDIVKGFISISEADSALGEIINIGTDFEISIGDLVQTIAAIMNRDVNIQSDPQRLRPQKSEVQRLCAGNDKAKKLLGWKPEYNGYDGLKRGLTETISWFRNPQNLKQYKGNIYNL